MKTTATTTKTFGVFQHSSGPQGGYVVRTLFNDWVPAPYLASRALRVCKREYHAQNYADKLNQVAAQRVEP